MVSAQTLFRSLASGGTVVTQEWLDQYFDKDGLALSDDALKEIQRLRLDIQVDPVTREIKPKLPGNVEK